MSMTAELFRERPYADVVKGLSLEQLKEELKAKSGELEKFGVTTSVEDLIEQGVEMFGGDYDSVSDDKGRMTVTGASLTAAIHHFQPELRMSNTFEEDKLLLTTSNLAVAIQAYRERSEEIVPDVLLSKLPSGEQ